jgi:hypothetical protein
MAPCNGVFSADKTINTLDVDVVLMPYKLFRE